MSRRVVIDASVVLRALLRGSVQAVAVIRADDLAAPALIGLETANGLAKEMRFAGLDLDEAMALLEESFALPIEIVPDSELAKDGLAIASHLGLTAYDAAYVALAERLEAPLITADRQLAKRYGRSELIP
jgi:predicted nucleic acid-binding protein